MDILYAPLTMEDAEEFYFLAGNEKVAKTMRFNCPKSIEESNEVLKEYISAGNRAFAMRFKPYESLWGVFAFKSEPGSDKADLSQMLIPEKWGQGLGKQIVEDMVELARKNKWYKILEGYILETNTASRRMAEGNGFREIARRRFQGMTEDLVIYQLELY